ncbi:MAG: hypothetical protein LUE10_01650 [Alistipes sp.]|nr:hypothetical protein [Alistipes sp.]
MAKNICIKFFMALCALAQLVAVMPHHHHARSEIACINPFHAFEIHDHAAQHGAAGCGECCPQEGGTPSYPSGDDVSSDACGAECAGHFCLHNTTGHSDGECGFQDLDLDAPAKQEISFSVPVLHILYGAAIRPDPLLREMASSPDEPNRAVECGSIYGGTLALYPSFSAKAIAPRAPSFLA